MVNMNPNEHQEGGQPWDRYLPDLRRWMEARRPSSYSAPLRAGQQSHGPGPPRGSPQSRGSPWPYLEDSQDLLGAEIAYWDPLCSYIGQRPEDRAELHATKDSPVACIGPSGGNKSLGVICQNILTTLGLVVAVSSRTDLYSWTALSRARLGTVWSFLEDLPGATQIRFSPIQNCRSRSYAMAFGKRWTSTIDMSAVALSGEVKDQAHFRKQAANLIGFLCFYAATFDLGIMWVVEVLRGHDLEQIKDARKRLTELGRQGDQDAGRVAQALKGFLSVFGGEMSGIFTTASSSFDCYDNEAAVKAQENADCDFDALVRGSGGRSGVRGLARAGLERHPVPYLPRHDSIYISSGNAEDALQPLILEFLYRVKTAARAQARALDLAGKRVPLLVKFCFDELAISPIPDLPSWLAELRGRGISLVTGFQSWEQVTKIYNRRDLLTLFKTTLIFPGETDGDLLDLLTKVAGDFWQEVHGYAEGKGNEGWSGNLGYQSRPKLPQSDIAQGLGQDIVLMVDPKAHMSKVLVPPIWRDEFWPRLLINSAELAFEDGLTRYPLMPLAVEGWEHLEKLELSERFEALQGKFFR